MYNKLKKANLHWHFLFIVTEKIIKEIPIDSFNETFYFEDLTGTFSIHVAGESASFDFHIDIS